MVRAAAKIQSLTPPAALRLGDQLGSIGYCVAGQKRKLADHNLRLAFSTDLGQQERDRLVRRVFRHFGRSTVAFLRAPMFPPEEIARQVTVEGWEHLENAYCGGKGVIVTSGHIGNWDLLGSWLAQVHHLPVSVVAKDPKGAVLADYLRRMRESGGFAVLSKGESARPLLRILQRGEVVIILPDQNSGDVFVPFFGVPAGTVAGPASLALHTGAALLPVFFLTNPDGTFHVIIQPPIPTVSTGSREDDVKRIMTAFNEVLESMIRQYPEQWLWLHNRWKSVFEKKNFARAWQGRDAERDAAFARWHK